jgi:hypothetical protein
MIKYLVKNDRQLFAEFDSVTAAERYYMLTKSYEDQSIRIVQEVK